MTKAEKINFASKILAEGMRVIHKYIPNKNEIASFITKEYEGNIKSYFLEEATYLSLKVREKLIEYYRIVELFNSMEIERIYEMTVSGYYESKAFKEAVATGIIAEKRYIERRSEEAPNKYKVLKLINDEIKLISDRVDLIISLGAEFIIEKGYSMNKSGEYSFYKDAAEKMTIDSLARVVLKEVWFDSDGNSLRITDNKILKLLWRRFQIFFYDEVMYSDLSEYEKQMVFKDSQNFLNFMIREVPSIASAGALILWYHTHVPKKYKESPDVIVTLFLIAGMYRREEGILLDDYIALMRIYEHIIALYNKWNNQELFEGTKDDVEVFREIRLQSVMALSEIYIELFEFEKSIDFCFEGLMLASKSKYGEEVGFGPLLIRIAKNYERIDDVEAVIFIVNTLSGDFGKLSNSSIKLDEQTKVKLELSLYEIVTEMTEDELNEVSRKIEFESPLVSSLENILSDLYANDNIDSSALRRFISEVESFEELYIEAGPESKITTILSVLESKNLEQDMYEVKIDQLKSLLEEIDRSGLKELDIKVLKIQVRLHELVCKYLGGKTNIVDEFKYNIEELERLSSETQPYWYLQYIRVMSSAIKSDFDRVYFEIEKYSISFANIQLQNYIDNFNDSKFKLVTQGEYERFAIALITNIKTLEKDEILYLGDTDLDKLENSQSAKISKLLMLLWNVFLHKTKYINSFVSFESTSQFNSKRFSDIRSEIGELLEQHIIKGYDRSERLKSLSRELQKLHLPEIEEHTFLKEITVPNGRSIYYSLFTKNDNKRHLLILSYNPEGHENRSKVKFDYFFYDDFDVIETEFGDIMEDNINGISDLFDSSESTYKTYRYLIEPFVNRNEAVADRVRDQINQLIQVSQSISDNEVESVNIYGDSFIHQLPLEYLNIKENYPLGVKKSFTYVAKKEQLENLVDLNKPIVTFSEIPEQIGNPFLSQSKFEIDGIEKSINSELVSFRGFDATFTNFYTSLQLNPSIIHFSTHGIGDINSPAEANSILLAPDAMHSMFLSYSDVLDLNLSSVQLVVLSACNSSIGKIERGVSMRGLAYAFLFAGVTNVLATKNAVDDTKTSVFIPKFYSFLKDCSVHEALRKTRQYFHDTNYKDFKVFYVSGEEVVGEEKIKNCKYFLANWCLWS